jgi:glycosyltransferase involved in cell wall biosynthesis
MRCRLLYLVGQLRPGGLERQLYYLLVDMNRKQYRPEVVVWNFCETDTYVPQIRALGVPLHALPGTASGPMKLGAFRRLVQQLAPEVVHSYSFYTNFAAWWATRGTQAIAIGAVRSDFTWAKKTTGPWLGRLSARWPRNQIFNSFVAAEDARCAVSPFVPKHLFVVRNGLDVQHCQMVPVSTTGQARILGLGSLLSVKRWDRLLGAALALKRRGCDFVVQIAGDGPLRRSLEQQTQDLGLATCIVFLGHRDDIPRLLSGATFLVHTSDSEGCPNVVMEAMACGRAVVATDVGDIPDLVEDGQTGFVVPRENQALLVTRMATLITDRDLCRRMGEAGRAKAEWEFGLDRLVSETLAVYKAAGWKG